MFDHHKNDLVWRVANKLSSWASTIKTGLYVPSLFRSADIHMYFQSPAQRIAQKTLCAQGSTSGRPQKVLVIIPFKDKWNLTQQCLQSLELQKRGNHELLVALVDNGSSEELTSKGILSFVDKRSLNIQFRHLRYDHPFNFSALNNSAVKDCTDFSPDIIFMCNNDIQFIEADAFLKLVNFCRDQGNAGAVGCTLVFPDRKVQHLFVYIGSKIVGSHPHRGRALNMHEEWYKKPRPVGAVTGAVTLMKKEVFDRVGGLDEALPTSYQDVDLCLKIQEIGLINWVIPDVVMIHHETQTRSKETSWSEVDYMYRKWGDRITHNPYVHPRLNRSSEHYVLR